MSKTMGPGKYQHDVADVTERLSDALRQVEAGLRARDEEIRRLRAEVERLGGRL
jgi:hypothetical protein